MSTVTDITQSRQTEFPIEAIFTKRWSPRAMSGKAIDIKELDSLFEAARWAPSSFNNQPWRFVYALRDTSNWEKFLNLLVPFNQTWAKNASALVVIVSKNTFDHNGEPMPTHSFDTGSAWQNLSLEGSARGLVVHGMGGFDYAKAKTELAIPDGYTVEAMAAIGQVGALDVLPEQMQKGEVPSQRKPLKDIVFEGQFGT